MIALPIYLANLGPTLWGLVSFVFLLQIILGILDNGLAQALTREFALRITPNSAASPRAAALMLGFERIYWAFSFAAAALLVVSTPLILKHWLNLNGLAAHVGEHAMWAAAALFFVQFPGSIYRAVLYGAQAHVSANVLSASALLLRHLGGVLLVMFWPSLELFLAWQILVSLLETFTKRLLARRRVQADRESNRWDSMEMRGQFAFSATMALSVAIWTLAIQIDKIIISSIVPIEQFAYYAIASSVAFALLGLTVPLLQSAYPQVVRLAREDPLRGKKLNQKLMLFIVMVIIIVAIIYAVYGKQLLMIWLRDRNASNNVYGPLAILLLGSALHSIYSIGYINLVAAQDTIRITIVNVIGLLFAILFLPRLVLSFGLVAGGVPWVFINLVGILLSLKYFKVFGAIR